MVEVQDVSFRHHNNEHVHVVNHHEKYALARRESIEQDFPCKQDTFLAKHEYSKNHRHCIVEANWQDHLLVNAFVLIVDQLIEN